MSQFLHIIAATSVLTNIKQLIIHLTDNTPHKNITEHL